MIGIWDTLKFTLSYDSRLVISEFNSYVYDIISFFLYILYTYQY